MSPSKRTPTCAQATPIVQSADTAATLDWLIELRRCEERFEQIAAEAVGQDVLSDALLATLRDAQARAGRALFLAVEAGQLPPPIPTPPWWRIGAGIFDDTPFDDLVLASGHIAGKAPQPREDIPEPLARFLATESARIGLNLPADSNAIAVTKVLKAFHELHERHAGLDLPSTLGDYTHRQIFLEAIAEWLPRRHPSLGDPIALPSTCWVTKGGTPIAAIADCFGTPLLPLHALSLIRLTERCALVCRLLLNSHQQSMRIDDATSDGSTIPASAPDTGNTFLRQGDSWIISLRGRLTRVRHSLGMTYLRGLLQQPNTLVSCRELRAAFGSPVVGVVGADQVALPPDRGDDAGHVAGAHRAQPAFDDEARQVVEAKLVDTRLHLDDAKAARDATRQEELQAQILKLESYLKGGTFGGRTKGIQDRSEKDRRSVSQAVGRALRNIRVGDQVIGQHFSQQVDTGWNCAYRSELDLVWMT